MFYIIIHSPSFCLEKWELNSLTSFGFKVCYCLSYDSVYKHFTFSYSLMVNASIYFDRIQKQMKSSYFSTSNLFTFDLSKLFFLEILDQSVRVLVICLTSGRTNEFDRYCARLCSSFC